MLGAYQVKQHFTMEFFMIPDQPVTKFLQLNIRQFEDGSDFKIFHILHDVDVSSEES